MNYFAGANRALKIQPNTCVNLPRMDPNRPPRRMCAPIPPVVPYALRRRIRQAAREAKVEGRLTTVEGLRLPGNTDRTKIYYNLRGRRMEVTADTKGIGKTTMYMDPSLYAEVAVHEICELFRDEAEHYRTQVGENESVEDIVLSDYRQRPQRWEVKRKGAIKVVQQFALPNCIPPPIMVTYYKSFLDDIPSAGALINVAGVTKDTEYVVGDRDGNANPMEE